MATDARKHSAFAAAEHPSMAALNALSLSINDVMPVSNATTQASAAAALSSAISPTTFATNPLVTIRADAPGLHRIEYTFDGSVFLPASGVLHFASTSAMNTWASSNSALLTVGDQAYAGSALYAWTGSAMTLYDTGWLNVGYATGYTLNARQAQYRRVGDLVIWRGDCKPQTGSFAASAVVNVITAVGSTFLPPFVENRQIAGNSAGNSVRAYVDPSVASYVIVTGSTPPAYIDLGGMYYFAT